MNPLNQTKEKREAVPNGVSRVGIAALGVLLQVLWIVWAALKLTRYYAWVQLAISVLALLLALRIYGRHTNSATKLSWIIVILTFPIFGVCLYLLFGRSGAVNIMRGRFTRTDTELQPHYATPTAPPCPRTRPCKTRSTTCRPRLTIPPAATPM